MISVGMGYTNDSMGGRDGSGLLREKSCLMRGIGDRERDSDRLKSGPWMEHVEGAMLKSIKRYLKRTIED